MMMQRALSSWRSAIAISVMSALVGCGGNSYPDLDKYMADVKAKPAGHIPPIPAFTAYQNFIYGASGLRSPFQPPIDVKEITRLQRLTKIRPDPNRTKEFLEQYTFDSLGMVGTVQMGGTLWGLVSDPDGSVHRVKVGNYVGKNHGHIVELTENYVAVVEIVANGPDEWVERPRKLMLRTSDDKTK